MHYSISTDFLITLFGFLSSLGFNNRIENLTLITKFRWAPFFGGGWGPEAVPLLSPSRAGHGDAYVLATAAWASGTICIMAFDLRTRKLARSQRVDYANAAIVIVRNLI